VASCLVLVACADHMQLDLLSHNASSTFHYSLLCKSFPCTPVFLSCCLLRDYLLQGDWLLSNAASSALGHMVLLKPYMPARSALHVSASVLPPILCGCAARCATHQQLRHGHDLRILKAADRLPCML